MRIELNCHVKFKNPETGIFKDNDPNCEGRVEDISFSGDFIYVSNMNMPYMGTLSMQSIPVRDVVNSSADDCKDPTCPCGV